MELCKLINDYPVQSVGTGLFLGTVAFMVGLAFGHRFFLYGTGVMAIALGIIGAPSALEYYRASKNEPKPNEQKTNETSKKPVSDPSRYCCDPKEVPNLTNFFNN